MILKLINDRDLEFNDSLCYTGFHYVDYQFDNLSSIKKNGTCIQWNCDEEPDWIYLIGRGYRGANSYQNSNRIRFKTLSNYRQFLKQSFKMRH